MKKALALVAAGMAVTLSVPALAAPKGTFDKSSFGKVEAKSFNKSLPKGLLKAYAHANENGRKGIEKAIANQYKSRGC
ncbi:hypothetical protein I5E68_13980 [Novosphingobium sp. YJ-S2-02]|uniref:Uncharacterized protein n=1 Tax=Novosphingobium aureum TaxID=2792964 RepID=A0A931HEU0_9SPHN|nr:hypothetical protein [Novosphingobium aureum]MBH0114051.1 hypothetical protein [Novosphingobium aureum]